MYVEITPRCPAPRTTGIRGLRIWRLALLAGVALFCVAAQSDSQDRGAVLGRLSTGAELSFAKSGGEWRLQVAGRQALRLAQTSPVGVEVFTNEKEIQDLSAGYKSDSVTRGAATGLADVAVGSATLQVRDEWTLAGDVLRVQRRVRMAGDAPGGFYSQVLFSTGPELSWPQIDFLAPALLYADPSDNGSRSVGGTLNYGRGGWRCARTFCPRPCSRFRCETEIR